MRAILKNLLLELRKGGVASRDMMSFHERKKAVRHAADVALATARGNAPRWSRSLAAELSQHGHLLRPAIPSGTFISSASECSWQPGNMRRCKGTILKSRRKRRRGRGGGSIRARPKSRDTAKAAGILGRALVRRRTRALREMVPGGRGMDECTLLGETLDYAVSLKAQVDAMQLLVRALQAPNSHAQLC